MKNVLITGGAGFIGSNFIYYLHSQDKNINIFNLDLLTYAGNAENLSDIHSTNYHFVKGDICDHDLVANLFRQYDIDTVVHFAAESHVDRSIANPLRFMQTNIIGTATLLECALHYWENKKSLNPELCRFHHISTDEVYGSLNKGDPPFSEKTPYAPNSPYAASKAASDHIVRSYYHTFKLPITITNCSNNYGPYQYPEKLIPLIIQNALQGKQLPIYGDGKQIRDWLYVEDHCEAIYQVIEKGTAGETFNVGGNNQPYNIDIVKTICKILDDQLPHSAHRPHAQLIQYVADRPGHDRRYAMDISKIQKQLGWEPRESLESGLLKTVGWYLEHPNWINAILNRTEYQEWIKANYKSREVIKK